MPYNAYRILRSLALLIIILWGRDQRLYAQGSEREAAAKVVVLKDESEIKGKIIEAVPGKYVLILISGGQLIKVYQQDIKKIKESEDPSAQTILSKDRREIIFLKDGSRLFGKIIDEVPDDYVILKLSNGEEVTFFAEEIAEIKYNKRSAMNFYHNRHGFYHETDLGILVGEEFVSNGNSVNFSVHTINGYRFKHWLQTGLGVGLNFQPNMHVVPFYLNIGGDIGRSEIVPLYFVNVGYNYAEERRIQDIDMFDDVEGGMYFHFGGGVKIKMSKMAMSLKAGYSMSDVTTSREFVDWTGQVVFDTTVDRQIRRFTVTLGFGF